MLIINYINRNMSRFILNSSRKFLLNTNINSQKVAKCKFSHVTNVSLRNNCAFKALKHSKVIGTLYVRHQSTTDIPKETVLNSQIDSPATQILKTVGSTSDTVREKDFINELPDIPVPQIEEVAETINKFHPNGEVMFESIGLGGYSPIGIVQSFLEWLHIYQDMPWWSAIILSTVCIKVLLFPVAIGTTKYSAKWTNQMPQIMKFQEKITIARESGDMVTANLYLKDMSKFIKEKNVSPFKMMVPLFIQAPIFISIFWALRGMSNTPVESFKDGGLWWFTDLTTSDPYYILPALTSTTVFLMLKYGSLSSVNTSVSPVMKYFRNSVPVITFLFTMKFPTAMLCYWSTSNFLSMIQVMLLNMPKIRTFFNIPLRAEYKPNITRKSEGFVKELQSSWANMKVTHKVSQNMYADEMVFNAAARGPLKRTYKYNPTITPPTAAQILAKKK